MEAFSLAELREVVGRLVGEVQRLHSGNVALQARVDTQQATISALRAENQALRDEVARLKGLLPRPPSRPSGMEQATQPGAAGKDEKRPKLPRASSAMRRRSPPSGCSRWPCRPARGSKVMRTSWCATCMSRSR